MLALVATGGPNPTVERPEEFLYGVAPLLPPLLAALCAGGILATRAGGRGAARAHAVAVGAGACLLVILLYPLRVEPKRIGGGLEYRSILGVATTWPDSVRDFFVGIEPSFQNPFVAYAHAGLAILGLSAAFGTVGRVRRALAVAGLATVFFWMIVAHALLLGQPLEDGQSSPWDQIKAHGGNPWGSVLAYAGGYLLAFCVPFCVALVGAMFDLAAPAALPEPQPAPPPEPHPAPAS
jgi:hypothetical protein